MSHFKIWGHLRPNSFPIFRFFSCLVAQPRRDSPGESGSVTFSRFSPARPPPLNNPVLKAFIWGKGTRIFGKGVVEGFVPGNSGILSFEYLEVVRGLPLSGSLGEVGLLFLAQCPPTGEFRQKVFFQPEEENLCGPTPPKECTSFEEVQNYNLKGVKTIQKEEGGFFVAAEAFSF